MITYKEDSLLNAKDKNIYACLVKPEYFKSKMFSLKVPNISIENKHKLIELIEDKYGNIPKGFKDFVKNLEIYSGIKYSALDSVKQRYLNQLRNERINIIFLRVISISLCGDGKKSINLFQDFISRFGYVRIGKTRLKILNFNKRLAYLAGVIAGDGHLSKRGNEIVIADGQSDKNKLRLSKDYIYLIAHLFEKEFNLRGAINNHTTWWRFRIDNVLLCKFFNYYFEIPLGKKCRIIKIPGWLSSTFNEKYFWRGLMDTDGYIREKGKEIIFKSRSLILLNQFMEFLKRNKINAIINKDKNGEYLRIFVCDFLRYAEIMGFSHPRKKEILISHLREGPKYKVLSKINKNMPIVQSNIFKYLRPYKKVVYINLNQYGKKSKKLEVINRLELIKNTFGVKITEVKRNRYSNQFVICSRSFLEFVKNNAKYDLPWQPLNKAKIKLLSEEWKI